MPVLRRAHDPPGANPADRCRPSFPLSIAMCAAAAPARSRPRAPSPDPLSFPLPTARAFDRLRLIDTGRGRPSHARRLEQTMTYIRRAALAAALLHSRRRRPRPRHARDREGAPELDLQGRPARRARLRGQAHHRDPREDPGRRDRGQADAQARLAARHYEGQVREELRLLRHAADRGRDRGRLDRRRAARRVVRRVRFPRPADRLRARNGRVLPGRAGVHRRGGAALDRDPGAGQERGRLRGAGTRGDDRRHARGAD